MGCDFDRGSLTGVALIVGLIIGIVQVATSINEMTLSFIPKIAALVAVLIFLARGRYR